MRAFMIVKTIKSIAIGLVGGMAFGLYLLLAFYGAMLVFRSHATSLPMVLCGVGLSAFAVWALGSHIWNRIIRSKMVMYAVAPPPRARWKDVTEAIALVAGILLLSMAAPLLVL